MATEPIAIVGMACRLPAECSSPSKLWDFLMSNHSAQSDVPLNRWNAENWYHPNPKRRGAVSSAGGYFLSHDDSFRQFEPSFFGINPLEAETMDPQQRKLLEVVYEAFESAGVTLEQMAGSQTACYVGAFTADFNRTLIRDVEGYRPYESTGSDMTILSNRINYVFDLKGPSMTVDTACSSSLYALHLACQSLQLGDCEGAIVGGTNILMDTKFQSTATKLGILSPTSTCHTFDENADGFGRAEGITAIYVKRLSDALASRDPIRAIIRATSINTNGRGPGINHPGDAGQEAVIRKAYSKAGLDPGTTAYVECHGTGTPVGDPIEVRAVGNVFAEGRTAEQPLLLTALKSNIGHTEGASGLASVIKTALSLEEGVIPATFGVRKVNPALDLKGGRLRVVRDLQHWPKHLKYRRASINSFGYGGANAHIILDDVNSYLNALGHGSQSHWTFLKANRSEMTGDSTNCTETSLNGSPNPLVTPKYLLVSSAFSLPSLQNNISSLAKALRCDNYFDVTYTMASHRSQFQHRAFNIVSHDLIEQAKDPQSWSTGKQVDRRPVFALIFTGQGAQWPQMGFTLINRFPVFRRSLEKLEEAMATVIEPPDWTIIEALFLPAELSRLNEVTVSVTLCSALQIALVDLLESWGIRARAVAGHSSGEAAAAYAAGFLTASEAVITSYYRALAIKKHRLPGAMMAVGLGAAEALPYVEGRGDIFIACRNSPASVTLSGSDQAVEEVGAILRAKLIFARKVMTGGNANHSPFVAKAASYFRVSFLDALPGKKEMSTRKPRMPMYSCITGNQVQGEDVGIEYWGDNIEKPVLFDEALQALLRDHEDIDYLIELGPHSALAGPVRQIRTALGRTAEDLKYLHSLVRGRDNVEDMLRLAGTLHLTGYPIDLGSVNAEHDDASKPAGRFVVDLPPYQWNYEQQHWVENRISHEWRFRKHPRHDLLGSREPTSSDSAPLWQNVLKVKEVPWIADHKIGNSVLFPAAGYVAMAVEAVRQVAENTGVAPENFLINRLAIVSPIVFFDDQEVEIIFNLYSAGQASSSGVSRTFSFEISSLSDSKWSKHASGTVGFDCHTSAQTRILNEDANIQLGNEDWYARFAELGLNYGPTFKTLRDIRKLYKMEGAVAQIALRSTDEIMKHQSRYLIHPATLDGCLQLAFVAAQSTTSSNIARAYLPFEIKSMTIRSRAQHAGSAEFATVQGHGNVCGLRTVESDFAIFDEDGVALVEAEVTFVSVEGGFGNAEELAMPQPYQRLVWLPDVDELRGEMTSGQFNKLDAAYQRLLDDSAFGHLLQVGATGGVSSEGVICDIHQLKAIYILVKLISHKDAGLHILHIGHEPGLISTAVLYAAGAESSNPAYASYNFATNSSARLKNTQKMLTKYKSVSMTWLEEDKSLKDLKIADDSVDLLLFERSLSDPDQASALMQQCKGALKTGGRMIVISTGEVLSEAEFAQPWLVLDDGAVILVKIVQKDDSFEAKPGRTITAGSEVAPLWLIYHDHPPALLESIENSARASKKTTRSTSLLGSVKTVPKGARVIVLAELEKAILSCVDQKQLAALQHLFQHASWMIWATRGSLLSGRRPEMALMLGMAKVIQTEYPNLQLRTLDFESTEEACCADLLLSLEQRDDEVPELHFIERNTLLHVGRYVTEEDGNRDDFLWNKIMPEPAEFGPGLELDMVQVGKIESFYFKEIDTRLSEKPLSKGEVVVRPSAYALNKSGVLALRGQTHDSFFNREVLGVVCKVPSEQTILKPGDLVICLRPGKFNSELCIDERLCLPCQNEEQGKAMLGLILPSCLALYALASVARVRRGETVLIAAPGDLLTLAAIRVLRRFDAKMLVGFADEAEKDYLENDFGVLPESLIRLADFSSQQHLKKRGINVALVGRSSVDIGAIWKFLTSNGRLVLTDHLSRPDFGLLDPAVFARGTSICSVNFDEMMQHEPEDVQDFMHLAAFDLKASEWPETISFGIDKLDDAAKEVTSQETFGRVSLTCSPKSVVPVYRQPTSVAFRSDSSYILVGCLGGLGRSIALWMHYHGARHFIFMSRSGADKKEAAALIEDLGTASDNVSVIVVRGDVVRREDVDKAVSKAKCPVRGVIQAAAVFKDRLFADMDVDTFIAAIGPKVQGTINLHEATKDLDPPLDFFVMTSSTIGVVGTTTQSHYAAANAFLDYMARYRRSLGLQATSLSLGMVLGVGHVKENPEIRQALLRRGSYDITEAEFLRMMDRACRAKELSGRSLDEALIVTGLDSTRIALTPLGETPGWAKDTRLGHISHTVGTRSGDPGLSARQALSSTDPTSNLHLRQLLDGENTGKEELKAAVQQMILHKLSSLVLVSVEKLTASLGRPLSELGMDSIIGAELRGWTWKELRAEMSFMQILEGGRSLSGLVDMIWDGVGWDCLTAK